MSITSLILRNPVYSLSSLLRILPLVLSLLSPFAWGEMVPARAQGAINYIPDNPFGTNIFLHKEVEDWKIEETLRLAAAANIQWVKQEFPWNEIEFRKGYFTDDKWQKSSWEKFDHIVDLAGKYGLRVIARIDHAPDWAVDNVGTSPLVSNTDLADFANALLERYKGRLTYVQIWNEPNLSAEWIPGQPANPDGYAEMLQTVYPAVKQAHPNAVILSAPMAMTLEKVTDRGNMSDLDYWAALYKAGAKGNFDIASANGYGLDRPPEDAPDPTKLNFRRAELLRQIMVDNGDNSVPIWFSEYGWNTAPDTLPESERNLWRHVTPQQQAEWTVSGIDYARQHWPWAGVVSIWYLRQVGDIPPDRAEYYFGMVDPEFVPQPVYNSVKVAASNYSGPASRPLPTAAAPAPTSLATAPPGPTEPPQPSPQDTLTPTEGLPTAAALPGVSPSATSAPATATSPTSVATPPLPVTTVTGTPALIMYIAGGLLLFGGVAGLIYYFTKGRA